MELLRINMTASVTIDDSFPDDVQARALRLKIALDNMKPVPITDRTLMNDVLDAMESIVNVYRRAKAIGNI